MIWVHISNAWRERERERERGRGVSEIERESNNTIQLHTKQVVLLYKNYLNS